MKLKRGRGSETRKEGGKCFMFHLLCSLKCHGPWSLSYAMEVLRVNRKNTFKDMI